MAELWGRGYGFPVDDKTVWVAPMALKSKYSYTLGAILAEANSLTWS